jgi:hypothetical protein
VCTPVTDVALQVLSMMLRRNSDLQLQLHGLSCSPSHTTSSNAILRRPFYISPSLTFILHLNQEIFIISSNRTDDEYSYSIDIEYSRLVAPDMEVVADLEANLTHSLPGLATAGDAASNSVLEELLPMLLIDATSCRFGSLNPFTEGMFHVFISYRAAEFECGWVSKLYDTICLKATSSQREGRGVPLMERTKFPDLFNCDAFAQQKILNIFWDKACLADGYRWEGDGSKTGGGFIGAILQSMVFIPVLSSYVDEKNVEKTKGSIGQLLNANDDIQDNVLVEFIVAKFLNEYGRSSGDSSLFPCSVVLPLILHEKVFSDSGKLGESISMASNTKAFNVLKAAGYNPPPEMTNPHYLDPVAKQHPWSIRSVVKFFTAFQGVLTWKCGEGDRDVTECSRRIMASILKKLSACKALTLQLENNNPLALELRQFIENGFMGHYMCCLNGHGVKSIRALSQLDEFCVQEISTEMALALNKSTVEQRCKLKQLVLDAKGSTRAQPLNTRLETFFDQDASWSTALTSTCAVDLLMRRQLFLFIMIAAPLLMITTGVYLLLTPVTYSRVFPSKVEPEAHTHRNISTAVLMIAAAIGLGPICIVCSYAGSPRKGRYALAYAVYLACFLVTIAGFYADDANMDYCRFNSFENDANSIQSCVTAYAIAFAVRAIFFFSMFLVTLKRQEHYWDGFCLGISVVLACNFIIYRMAQFSLSNVILSAAVIAVVVSLNTLVRFKRRKSLADAFQEVEEDAQQYQIAWDAVRRSAGPTIMTHENTNTLPKMWCDSPHQPVEIPGTKMQIRQDCSDFELLYFLAEFVNEPFNDMVTLWCSGKNIGDQLEHNFFDWKKTKIFGSPPNVIRGPIKSVQRSIEKVHTVINLTFNFVFFGIFVSAF